jgi:alginate O-acetyltransferase complex protein AlgI
VSDLNFIGYIFSCALLACFISLFKGSVRVFLIFAANCVAFYWLNKNFLLLLLLQTWLIFLLCKSLKIKKNLFLALGLIVVLLPLIAVRVVELIPEKTIEAGITIVGISFYSLQMFSYLMDVRWERIVPQESFVRLFCYFVFFGNIISGPVERSKKFFAQLDEKFSLTSKVFTHAIMYIFLGLVKKFVLADNLKIYAIQPLNKPIENPGLPILIAILLSKFYLYYDLSGYSDMVVGVSKLLGIELTRNFNRPLFAMNIADFWKRWHISVSTWIRDYIFFPLLATPLVVLGTSGLITITFLIFGLWHGFQWTFVVYGLLQALFLILWPRIEKIQVLNSVPKALRWFLFYFFILAIPKILFFVTST